MLQTIKKQRSNYRSVDESNQVVALESKQSKSTSKILYLSGMFVADETIPCGTKVAPGAKFKKVWRVRNTGTKAWNSRTTLKYCWGNSDLEPQGKVKEVPVPPLKPWQEGRITVRFTAPKTTGYGFYQSHWRLHHRGQPFGQRMICTISVDPKASVTGEIRANCQRSSKVRTQESKEKTNFEEALTAVQAIRFADENQIIPTSVDVKSHTATPANTPFDISPPKTPEPPAIQCLSEQHDGAVSQEMTAAKISASKSLTSSPERFLRVRNTDADSEQESASIFSLSGSECPDEFVVVPLPKCFNITAPCVTDTEVDNAEDAITNVFGPRNDSFEVIKCTNTDGDEFADECKDDSQSISREQYLIELSDSLAMSSDISDVEFIEPVSNLTEETNENASNMTTRSGEESPMTVISQPSSDTSQNVFENPSSFDYMQLRQSGSSTGQSVGRDSLISEQKQLPHQGSLNNDSIISTQSSQQEKGENVIHVLPESIVNGAITAATHVMQNVQKALFPPNEVSNKTNNNIHSN